MRKLTLGLCCPYEVTAAPYLGPDPLLQREVLCRVVDSFQRRFAVEGTNEFRRVLRVKRRHFLAPRRNSYPQTTRFNADFNLTTTVCRRCLTFSVLSSLRVRKPRMMAPTLQNALCCSAVRTWRRRYGAPRKWR